MLARRSTRLDRAQKLLDRSAETRLRWMEQSLHPPARPLPRPWRHHVAAERFFFLTGSSSPFPRASDVRRKHRAERLCVGERVGRRRPGRRLVDHDPVQRSRPGERRRRAGPRRCPRQRREAERRAVVEQHGRDRLARRRADGALVGLVSGFVRRRQLAAAQVVEERPVGEGPPRRPQSPAERTDLLRPAAAALRVHDGAGRPRPADRRQPGRDRHPGRPRGCLGQLPARRARLSHGRGDDHRLEQELRGQPAHRVRVSHHRWAVRCPSPIRAVRCPPISR